MREKFEQFKSVFRKEKEISEKKGIELTEEERLIIKANLETYRKEGNWRALCRRTVEAKILYPKKDLKLGEKEWKGINAKLEEFRKKGKWWLFSEIATLRKILASKEIKTLPGGGLEVK